VLDLAASFIEQSGTRTAPAMPGELEGGVQSTKESRQPPLLDGVHSEPGAGHQGNPPPFGSWPSEGHWPQALAMRGHEDRHPIARGCQGLGRPASVLPQPHRRLEDTSAQLRKRGSGQAWPSTDQPGRCDPPPAAVAAPGGGPYRQGKRSRASGPAAGQQVIEARFCRRRSAGAGRANLNPATSTRRASGQGNQHSGRPWRRVDGLGFLRQRRSASGGQGQQQPGPRQAVRCHRPNHAAAHLNPRQGEAAWPAETARGLFPSLADQQLQVWGGRAPRPEPARGWRHQAGQALGAHRSTASSARHLGQQQPAVHRGRPRGLPYLIERGPAVALPGRLLRWFPLIEAGQIGPTRPRGCASLRPARCGNADRGRNQAIGQGSRPAPGGDRCPAMLPVWICSRHGHAPLGPCRSPKWRGCRGRTMQTLRAATSGRWRGLQLGATAVANMGPGGIRGGGPPPPPFTRSPPIRDEPEPELLTRDATAPPQRRSVAQGRPSGLQRSCNGQSRIGLRWPSAAALTQFAARLRSAAA